MAWWIPLVAAGASLLGSLLSSGGKGGTGAQISPVGYVQGNTAPAMGDYLANTLAMASADKAPTDFQVTMGDMTLPFNLAARRRAALASSAQQSQASLFGQSQYQPMAGQQSSLWDSLLPMATMLLGSKYSSAPTNNVFSSVSGGIGGSVGGG